MTHEEEELLREQLHRILDIVIDTNSFEARTRSDMGTLPAVFLEYSGHVNQLQLTIHANGWRSGENAEKLIDCWLDKPFTEEFLQKVEDACKAALTDKKESDVLAKDIEIAEAALKGQRESIRDMKRNLKKLRRKEGSSADAGTTAELV